MLAACGPHAVCRQSGVTRTCTCKEGYERRSSDSNCTLINQCTQPRNPCGASSTCFQVGIEPRCTCVGGYESPFNNGSSCVPINRCRQLTHRCPANSTCQFAGPNQFSCVCPSGFELDADDGCLSGLSLHSTWNDLTSIVRSSSSSSSVGVAVGASVGSIVLLVLLVLLLVLRRKKRTRAVGFQEEPTGIAEFEFASMQRLSSLHGTSMSHRHRIPQC